MRLFEVLSPNFQYIDERGELIQLVQKGFVQVNLLKTHQGVSRGGHYHKFASEAFYVISGRVEVSLSWKNLSDKAVFCEGDFFLIPPGRVHSLCVVEECVMLAMYDRPIVDEDGKKDIYPVEVLDA